MLVMEELRNEAKPNRYVGELKSLYLERVASPTCTYIRGLINFYI